MQNFCPRELWASFAMWTADKTRTPDPEILLVCFLGKWRCTGETWEIPECAKGCFSRRWKRTKQENSQYRTLYLPQRGDVRRNARKVKAEKLKLPYEALQTKGTYRKYRFYMDLKERQKIVRQFPGKYYQPEGAAVIRAEVQQLSYGSTYATMRYGLLQDVPQTREQPIAILYQGGPSRSWQNSVSCKERGAITGFFIHPKEM